MPKSRKRRRPSASHHQKHARGAQARAANAQIAVLHATDEAEARGDAAGALGLIETHLEGHGDLTFWRASRVDRLYRLAELGPFLPGWVTSRWILEQAAQSLDLRLRERRLEALRLAGGLEGTSGSRDARDLQAKIVDNDWVFRQLFLYEQGALRHFLRHTATPDLAVGADRIHEWADAPLRALSLADATATTLSWLDLGTGDTVATANLGAAATLKAGDHVLGRVVTSDDGFMFETSPLPVPADIARAVAGDPAAWFEPVTRWSAGETSHAGLPITWRDFPLVSDVPVRHQREILGWEAGHDADPSVDPDDAIQSKVELLRNALDECWPPSVSPHAYWPVVATTLLEPQVYYEFVQFLEAEDAPDLVRLTWKLSGPAAKVASALAVVVLVAGLPEGVTRVP